MVEASDVYKEHIDYKRQGEKAEEFRKEDPTPQPFESLPMGITTITFKNYNRCLSYLIVSFNRPVSVFTGMEGNIGVHAASNRALSRLAK
jgi:hypothetical protein